jgi:hypothetical protein
LNTRRDGVSRVDVLSWVCETQDTLNPAIQLKSRVLQRSRSTPAPAGGLSCSVAYRRPRVPLKALHDAVIRWKHCFWCWRCLFFQSHGLWPGVLLVVALCTGAPDVKNGCAGISEPPGGTCSRMVKSSTAWLLCLGRNSSQRVGMGLSAANGLDGDVM